MEIRAYLDYEAHGCSRSFGTFQVIELKDSYDHDITDLVQIGKLYTSIEELRRELDMAYNMPISAIEVIEDN